MILQSQDRYDDFAVFDPESGAFVVYQKSAFPLMVTRPIGGHYAQVDEGTIMLFRLQDQLHLRIEELDFVLGESMIVRIDKGDSHNILRLLEGSNTIFTWKYQRPRIFPPLEDDLTPFVEEEDFDFGLYIQNVTQDQGRRNRAYRSD